MRMRLASNPFLPAPSFILWFCDATPIPNARSLLRTFMAKANTVGKMDVSTRVSGTRTECTV